MSAKQVLSEKQKRFADFYIETGNQTEAAKRAGYKQPHVQGNRLLEKVREYIDEKLAAKEDARIASQDEVLRFLTSVMRDELSEEVVVVVSIGDYKSEERIVNKKANIKDRIKAAEDLGKRYGAFDPASAPKPDAEDDPLSASLKALAGELDGVDDAD